MFRMRNVLLPALFVALTTLVLACSAPTSVPSSRSGQNAPQPTAAASQLDLPSGQMIVRTGNMTVLVNDAVQALEDVGKLATDNGGYLVSSSVQGGEGDRRASATFRVPSAKFDGAMAALRELGTRVLSESTTSQDVTEEYVDLQSRLRNLEASETQLLGFMTRAQNVDEVLKVQAQLNTVRGQIEQTRGRMQYLERTSAMSVINVTLLPETSAEALVRPGWDAGEIAKTALRALVILGQVLGSIAIWLGIFSPVWAPGAAIAIWWQRRQRRR